MSLETVSGQLRGRSQRGIVTHTHTSKRDRETHVGDVIVGAQRYPNSEPRRRGRRGMVRGAPIREVIVDE